MTMIIGPVETLELEHPMTCAESFSLCNLDTLLQLNQLSQISAGARTPQMQNDHDHDISWIYHDTPFSPKLQLAEIRASEKGFPGFSR